jgi:hypothetical protein
MVDSSYKRGYYKRQRAVEEATDVGLRLKEDTIAGKNSKNKNGSDNGKST